METGKRVVLREWDLGRTATRSISARLVRFIDDDGRPRRTFELVAAREDGREYSTRLPLRSLEDLAAAATEAREIVSTER